MRIEPVFLFDLDGTLVDSVYQHVLAWKEALDAEGIELSVWRIHRKIGMSGGLFTNQLLREFRKSFTRPRPYRGKESSMRTTSPETSMNLIPPPGTTEALELGCTCQFIAHASDTQEREPPGMSIDPDSN